MQVANGAYHSCALTDAGHVYCWGDDTMLQLGEGLQHRHTCGVPLRDAPCRPFAGRVPDLESVVSIAADGLTTCALRSTGDVHCFGELPTPMPWLPRVTRITMGAGLLCGLTDAGNLTCIAPRSGAVVLEVGDVSDVSAGRTHYCYVTGGEVWCGGQAGYGELGQPPEHACSALSFREHCEGGVRVELPAEVVDVEAGGRSTCVRTIDEEVLCWGALSPGELLLPLPELAGPALQMAVRSQEVCVIGVDGSLSCHGVSDRPPVLEPRPGVVHIDLFGGARQIGGAQRCLVEVGGGVVCTGNGFFGELGRGPTSGPRVDTDYVSIGAPADWAPPRPPAQVEAGWMPLPTLHERCLVERATRPSNMEPFPVRECLSGTCVTVQSPAGELGMVYELQGSADLGGVFSFLYFTDEHRVYGLASAVDGRIVAALRSPADFSWATSPLHEFCVVETVAVGEGYGMMTITNGHWPLRALHAPLEELHLTTPQHVFRGNPPYDAAAATGADVFALASYDVTIHQGAGARREASLVRYASRLHVVGQYVVASPYGAQHIWAAGTRSPRRLLVDLPDEEVAAMMAVPGRLVWIAASPILRSTYDRAELWTARLAMDMGVSEVRSLGPLEPTAVYGPLAVGDGFVSYSSPSQELVVVDLETGVRRRGPPAAGARRAPLFITDGRVATAPPSGSGIALTPIATLPLDP